MTHTPGPWYAVDNGPYISIRTADWLYAPSVADVCSSKFLEDGDNSKANAALIAAAPDLLEACKRTINAYRRGELINSNDAAFIDAVIANAEGRS